MSDSVIIILALCTTYVVSMLINKWNPIRGKFESHRKDGGKK